MSVPAYYNEHDKFAAQWLRNLIAAGHIAPGVVDDRSIEDVRPDDLREFTQCHFFAGIGVWSHALRLAGWSDDRPVWTGSCPCQPFSAAGKGSAFADERHLWPAFHHLIKECRPPVVFGEQVASKDADTWIDLVQTDLEAVGYAVGAVPFPSASVGAPHIRDRLYWVAYSDDDGPLDGVNSTTRRRAKSASEYCCAVGVADASGERRQQIAGSAPCDEEADGREGRDEQQPHGDNVAASACEVHGHQRPGPTNGFWRDADWLLCRDGKWRPVEPGTQPLVNGAPARVGRLRAYGNAISPQVAATFISAAMKAQP